MSFGIKLVAVRGETIEPPEWVVSFDPERSEVDPPSSYPTGHVESDADPVRALRFESFAAASLFWRTQSKSVPFRPDGRPNRPMSVFTVEIVEVK